MQHGSISGGFLICTVWFSEGENEAWLTHRRHHNTVWWLLTRCKWWLPPHSLVEVTVMGLWKRHQWVPAERGETFAEEVWCCTKDTRVLLQMVYSDSKQNVSLRLHLRTVTLCVVFKGRAFCFSNGKWLRLCRLKGLVVKRGYFFYNKCLPSYSWP